MLFIVDVHPDLVSELDDTSQASGIRLLYKDRYPYATGSSIRYKLVEIDAVTGEMTSERLTNWIDIP